MSKFKLTILLLSLALLVGSLAATPIAAASAAITVKAEVTPSSGEVVVTGTISSGAGTAVTVQVINPSGGIDFMNQSISGDGGHYRFSYSLNRNSEGVYHVRAGGTGVETPATTQFTYRIGQSSGNSAVAVAVSSLRLRAAKVRRNCETMARLRASLTTIQPQGRPCSVWILRCCNRL